MKHPCLCINTNRHYNQITSVLSETLKIICLMKKCYYKFLLLFVLIVIAQSVIGSNKVADKRLQRVNNCSAMLENDLLVIQNSRISRTYEWNKGNLITKTLIDKQTKQVWNCTGKSPDINFPGQPKIINNGTFYSKRIKATAVKPEHIEATVICKLGELEIKRIFRIYPNCPAIACDIYLRGKAESDWTRKAVNLGDLKNIENQNEITDIKLAPVIEKLELPGKHWMIKTVEFHDVTDRNNNLVYERKSLVYSGDEAYKGNLMFATNQVNDKGVFILKEAPTSDVQLAYPGSDFLANFNSIRMIGAGMYNLDLDSNVWKKGYGFVTGVYGAGEISKLIALREYQEQVRIHMDERDDMILMNTWGDRSQDKKVNEAFCLAELEAGYRLGITHFQLDDGWQTGKSANSAFEGGSFKNIWRNPNYWKPNSEKFPRGFGPLIKKGKKLGIKICLWFNPDSENGYENWEKDADALLLMYHKFGILTFKIDGVKLPTKKAEINFRKMLDKVVTMTKGKVVFNLDVTAGRRGGYNYFNEYGNIFLENRYTDFKNYYPFWTLRNLWQLSQYIPAQNLQIEFLNKWRNRDKYGDDIFSPGNYSFDYLFAITMAAQPLAWFEATGLPEEAFSVGAPVIKRYHKIQHDFHSGRILPIGEEPSGRSWTGFQSIQDKKGYFLVFREANKESRALIKTWLKKGVSVKCTPLIGNGKEFSTTVGLNGTVSFELPEQNQYALFSYTLKF